MENTKPIEKYHGERIYLRKIKDKDINNYFMSWFQDKELMEFYTNSKNNITYDKLLKSIEEGEKSRTSFTYGIFYNKNDDCMGTIKIGPINYVHKICDLVVLLGNKKYHGKGLATEAILLGNMIAFDIYDIRKLFSGMYESNISSIKAYTRAGWIIEGRLKGHYFVNNKAEDRILVGCFNPKYFSQEEINKAKLNEMEIY